MQSPFFRFPAFKHKPDACPVTTLEQQIDKIASEVDEVRSAWEVCCTHAVGDSDLIDELLDVIHSTETALRMIVGDDEKGNILLNIHRWQVIQKNRVRGYYDEDFDKDGRFSGESE